MKAIYRAAGSAVLLLATLAACDKIKPPLPQLQAPPPASAPADPQAGERERQAFVQSVQQELDELSAMMAKLRAQVAAANPPTKERLGRELDALEARWAEMQPRLTELKSATLATWRQLQAALSKSIEELKNTIQRLVQKAKS